MFKPHANPDLGVAAQALVQGLEQFARVEDRVTLLNDLNQCVGEAWHPLFIKLLVVVGESAPDSARVITAESMAHAMQRGQTPGGALNAWGFPAQLAAVAGQLGEGFLRMAVSRSLDPIAYVCAWYSQATNRSLLPQATFERTITALLTLFSASPMATHVYQSKLLADTANRADGTFSRVTSQRIATLANLWLSAKEPAQIAADTARVATQTSTIQTAAMAWRPLS